MKLVIEVDYMGSRLVFCSVLDTLSLGVVWVGNSNQRGVYLVVGYSSGNFSYQNMLEIQINGNIVVLCIFFVQIYLSQGVGVLRVGFSFRGW